MAKDIKYRVTQAGAEKASKAFKKVDSSIAGMAKSALKVSVAYFGAQGLIRGIKAAIEAAGEQEQAEKSLTVALGRRSQALLDQASALQQSTAYGDEAIISAQALIAAFVDDEEQIKAATEATLDLAAAKGMDLTAAADLVAKTLGSSTNALSRYGIQVEGAVGSTERLESLTGNLARIFGGQAKAQADTMTGSIEQMKNAMGDTAEAFGSLFSPVVTKTSTLVKWLAEDIGLVITALDRWINKVEEQEEKERERSPARLARIVKVRRYRKDMADSALEDMRATRGTTEDTVEMLGDFAVDFDGLLQGMMDDNDAFTQNWVDNIKATQQAEFARRQAFEMSLESAAKGVALSTDMASASRALANQYIVEGVFAATKSALAGVPFPLNIAAAAVAAGAANALFNEIIPTKKAALGADFVTSGPTQLIVGDNPGGRERVQVTPMSSPNVDGPQGQTIINNYITAPLVDEYIVDTLNPVWQRLQNEGRL